MAIESHEDWTKWWDARVAAMEAVLGKSESVVGHAPVPFDLGRETGGAADIVYFRNHLPGRISVTCELIGLDDQVPNALGNYELMICHRDDSPWGPNLISRLAYYTLDAELAPGDTMDIGPAVPRGSTIAALLYLEYARFTVLDRPAGLLLCLGITRDELEAYRDGRCEDVLAALKAAKVYPYTDLNRRSVL